MLLSKAFLLVFCIFINFLVFAGCRSLEPINVGGSSFYTSSSEQISDAADIEPEEYDIYSTIMAAAARSKRNVTESTATNTGATNKMKPLANLTDEEIMARLAAVQAGKIKISVEETFELAKMSKRIQPNIILSKEEEEKRKTGENYLPKGYSKYEIPKPAFGGVPEPLPVTLGINLRSVLNIDEENEAILLDMDIIVVWLDGEILDVEQIHLMADFSLMKQMPAVFLDKIWTPDIYLDNLEKLEKLKFMSPPISVAFNHRVGLLLMKQRLVPLVNCGMQFHHYPADTQICTFSFRSYSFPVEDLLLSWFSSPNAFGVFLQEINDANFDLRVGDLDKLIVEEELQTGLNKSYHSLQFKLFARRRLSYHLIQTYIPSVFFVIITWLCFFLPSQMIEARLGITMTTLLTLTAMFSSVRDNTPTVSYVKAIDVWMVMCILFIFLTLLEFSLMAWINHLVDKYDKSKQGEDEEAGEAAALSRRRETSVILMNALQLKKYKAWSTVIEKYALLVYSTSFTSFAVIYWIWLLTAADYFNWEVNSLYNKIDNVE